ncbi:MAG: restriction endonuclease subunit S [Candidatus Cryptobacteroides sp.]
MYQSQFIEMFGCKKPNAKVGDVSSVVSGKSISKDLEDIPGDIAYVKVADFNLPENNKYIQVSSRYVTSENANSSKLIPPGTIIFAKNGAASMSNKKRLTAIGCCIDMNTLAIIPNSQKVDSGFLYAIFDSLDLSFYVRQGAVPSISPHAIEGIEIYLPSFDEQLSFSKICKQADKSKFSGLKSQFIEMFGTLDNHPAEYAVKTLRDLSECYAGATPSTKVKEYWDNGSIPWMSSGEVHMEHVTETESKITESGYQQTSTKMVPVHSVVIALAGQGKTRGKVAITEIPLCTNQSLCAIVPSKDIHYEYLYHNLKGRYLELRGMAGDVNGRGGLNLKIVQSIQVIVPPIDEQMKFVAIAQQADKSKQIAFSRAS